MLTSIVNKEGDVPGYQWWNCEIDMINWESQNLKYRSQLPLRPERTTLLAVNGGIVR